MTITDIQKELQHKIDNKTKPVGALGQLESIALQIGIIQNTLTPQITNPHIVVFAGDHGIAKTGLVNPYPQAVTAQMVLNFVGGGAAINVLCRQNKIALKIVDSGVNYTFDEDTFSKKIINAKINLGTKNYLEENAITKQELLLAFEKGKEIVENIFDTGCNTICFGEMGIGNSSSAALIMSVVTGLPVSACVGRGTGINDEQLKNKIAVLEEVYEKRGLHILHNQSHDLLMAIGGYEIAMMANAYIAAANLRMTIVVDGFIATAALLIAQKIDPTVTHYCIFAHTSGEQGHEKMLHFLHAKPLLNLGMRLGEGTGAALAIPLIRSAVVFLNEMASFESASVSNKI